MTTFLSEQPSQSNDHLPPLPPPALTRRIKRHVVGEAHLFFAICAPGMESICADELLELGMDRENLRILPGGVEFTGRLPDCFLFHLHSRIATRILMRIGEFKATGFAALEKKGAEIPWELFIYPGFTVEISVTAKQSRLNHTGAIAERIERGVFTRLGSSRNREHALFSQRIFVRAVEDRFTLSLDASGEPLYKRGLKTHGGSAPLRETSAAAILRIAGYRPDLTLLDPMCGSGTFSLEAALMARNIPPGWFRAFAFMGWPAFREQQWAYLRRKAQAQVFDGKTAPIMASDISISACRRLTECLSTHDLLNMVQVRPMDFFDMSPATLPGMGENNGPGVIVLNPPYGRRLGSIQESAALLGKIGQKLKADFKGWRFALLSPVAAVDRRFPLPFTPRPFHHGGLTLTLMTGKIK
ncbi:MAG: RNA methyltransferase [Desulfobacterales bacterium]|jgi:putative N6-adenine-specific DNA methylase|nr:RNA methyltransferase [Desulfobacterales bacterium]